MLRRLLILALLAGSTLTLGSCLDSGPFIPKIEDTNFDPSLGVDLAASTKTASGLYYRDIIVGTGVPAAEGDSVFTSYQLFLRTGASVQTATYDFEIGAQQAIEGYDEGLRGMQVGGRRQLIIPPQLAYGPLEIPGIPPYSILVYVVDLTDIH